MGVEKQIIKEGNGVDIPKKHDEVAMEYTGKSKIRSVPRYDFNIQSRLALR